jgi:aerobic-type carbon monoxide dehydrogenase small subunit (CoxS/CutS family)
MMLAISYQNRKITTIEGLDQRGELDPLQKAFCDQGGQQCGFCTPGMILSARALLQEHPNPTVEDISKAIAGNLCRCTGYTKIIAAIQQASVEYRKSRQMPERIAR